MTSATPTIMDTQIANLVTVVLLDLLLLLVVQPESVHVSEVSLEERVNNAVLDIMRIRNVYVSVNLIQYSGILLLDFQLVIVIATVQMDFLVITTVSANVIITMKALSVTVAANLSTISRRVRNVTVTLPVSFPLSWDADLYLKVNYVNVKTA